MLPSVQSRAGSPVSESSTHSSGVDQAAPLLARQSDFVDYLDLLIAPDRSSTEEPVEQRIARTAETLGKSHFSRKKQMSFKSIADMRLKLSAAATGVLKIDIEDYQKAIKSYLDKYCKDKSGFGPVARMLHEMSSEALLFPARIVEPNEHRSLQQQDASQFSVNRLQTSSTPARLSLTEVPSANQRAEFASELFESSAGEAPADFLTYMYRCRAARTGQGFLDPDIEKWTSVQRSERDSLRHSELMNERFHSAPEMLQAQIESMEEKFKKSYDRLSTPSPHVLQDIEFSDLYNDIFLYRKDKSTVPTPEAGIALLARSVERARGLTKAIPASQTKLRESQRRMLADLANDLVELLSAHLDAKAPRFVDAMANVSQK